MDIKINYCSVWNYEPRAAGLADALKKEIGISSELIPGSNGVYDVIMDEKIIYSKNRTKRFPDNDEIIALIQNLDTKPWLKAMIKTKKGCLFWKQPFLKKEKKMKKLIFAMWTINKAIGMPTSFFITIKSLSFRIYLVF